MHRDVRVSMGSSYAYNARLALVVDAGSARGRSTSPPVVVVVVVPFVVYPFVLSFAVGALVRRRDVVVHVESSVGVLVIVVPSVIDERRVPSRVPVEERVGGGDDWGRKRRAPPPLGHDPRHAREVLGRAPQRRLDALEDIPGEAGREQFLHLVVVARRAQRVDRVEHRHPLPRLLHLDLLDQDGDRVLVVLPRILARQRHDLVELGPRRAAEAADHLQEPRLVRPIERHLSRVADSDAKSPTQIHPA
mmetsp:Transcript_12920/g.58298  ORF Transcript_12920/g.58298 Transcript_12920/m.58298 type:complete len:248 (+) Transcript_12920:1159-1902(+)